MVTNGRAMYILWVVSFVFLSMDELDRTVLRRPRVALVAGITNPTKIARILKVKGFLTEYLCQLIESYPTQIQQTGQLLNVVPTKGPFVFEILLSVLEVEYPDLATLLQERKR